MPESSERDEVRDNVALTPVFCISDVSSKTIDKFINELEDYQKEEAGSVVAQNVYIVTSNDPTTVQDDPYRTRTPVQHFESPFIGYTLEQLRTRWRQLFRDPYPVGGPFTGRTFIILDERSEEDDTCIIVSESVEKGEARAAFAICTDVLCGPEVGVHELNEGIYPDKTRDPREDDTAMGGGILYTRDYYQKRKK